MTPITVMDGDANNATILNATGIVNDAMPEDEEEEEHVREMIEVDRFHYDAHGGNEEQHPRRLSSLFYEHD